MAVKDLAIRATIRGRDALSGVVRRAGAAVRRHLTGPLRVARAATMGLRSGLGLLNGTLGLLGVGGLAVSSAGILKLASDHAKALDEVGKFARQVNFSVEALQEYDFAAARQGVSTEAVRASIKKLNQNLGESKAGYGQLNSVLKTMPKAFREQVLAAGSTEEAFGLVIAAIGQVQDPTQKAALAVAFFGRSGAELTRIAEAGADGIAALRTEARKYGVASKEQTDAAEQFVDTQENLNRTIAGVKLQIGSALLPVLRPLLDRLREWIGRNKELIASKVEQWVRGAIRWIREAIDTIRGWDWDAITKGAREVWDAIRGAAGAVGGFFSDLAERAGGWGNALLLLFGVKLVAALGSLPVMIGAVTAAIAAITLKRVIDEIDELQQREMKDRVGAQLARAKQTAALQRQVRVAAGDGGPMPAALRANLGAAGLFADQNNVVREVSSARPEDAAFVLRRLFSQASPSPSPGRPRVTAGEVKVEVTVTSDTDSRVRATTQTRGAGVTARTTTAPTGRRSVGRPVGAELAP